MPIPAWTQGGFLPPFVGATGADAKGRAPFLTSASEIISRFATSPQRIKILKGWLNYRDALLKAGIQGGFQWINGSFVEDCEKLRTRPPADIDVITFAEFTKGVAGELELLQKHIDLIDIKKLKANYHCDGYIVALHKDGATLIERAAYWYGLFSHQRTTAIWKGLLRVDILSDDAVALNLLNQEEAKYAP